MHEWKIEYSDDSLQNFLLSLTSYEMDVTLSAIKTILAVSGIDICSGSWGKPLGGGLYEFRIGASLDSLTKNLLTPHEHNPDGGKKVLVRIFCSFYGDRIVLLHHGYNKGKDPSKRRQQKEIAVARRYLETWKRRNRT